MVIAFRTRLFLWAALMAALVLAAVVVLGWSRVLAFEVDRLDERLCQEARRLGPQAARAEDLPRLERDMLGKLHLGAPEQLHLAFHSADGQTRLASPRPGPAVPGEGADWKPAAQRQRGHGQCSVASARLEGVEWRMARYSADEGRGWLAVDLSPTKGELQSALRSALWGVVPASLLLIAAGAWLLASLTMRPVNHLREAMKAMTGQALDQRLPLQGEDREFQDLIQAYNTMLARLEANFRQASRFSADAAHELKTPLTILQGHIEQAVNRSDRRAIQAELGEMMDEVQRLSGIVRKLLLLSQADAGQLALTREHVDLSAWLDELVADARMLLPEGRSLDAAIDPGLVLQADATLLRQALNNLLSNAVQHARPGGWITVEARRSGDRVVLETANATHTIGADERARFFERFYRSDAARHGAAHGHGLGLSLSREIARAHGGDLVLLPSSDNEVRLRLSLPAPR